MPIKSISTNTHGILGNMKTFHSCGITEIDVGTPPVASIDWKSFVFHFHRFESLSSLKGAEYESPSFTCFGFSGSWVYILVDPKHQKTTKFLCFLNVLASVARLQFVSKSILDSNGSAVGVKRVPSKNFGKHGFFWEWRDFMKRSDIVSNE